MAAKYKKGVKSDQRSAWPTTIQTPPDYFQRLQEDPAYAAQFTRKLYEIHRPLAEHLADMLDLEGINSLLDLGGGSGVVSLALLRSCFPAESFANYRIHHGRGRPGPTAPGGFSRFLGDPTAARRQSALEHRLDHTQSPQVGEDKPGETRSIHSLIPGPIRCRQPQTRHNVLVVHLP